jgi:hypothetical protein
MPDVPAPGEVVMGSRLRAAAACVSLAVPLAVAPPAVAAGSFATPLHSLGQGQSPPLRTAHAHPVAAGRTGSYPYRPVPHRQVPGALVTDPATTQTHASTSVSAPASGTGFAGNDNTDLVLPPDTNADIGYDAQGNAWLVQWVNLHYRMWERLAGQTTWSVQLTADGNTVFASLNNLCSTTNNGDPSAVYDRIAHRWVLTQFAFDTDFFVGTPFPPYGECVAVSQTADPTGAYNLYSWDVGSFGGNDYFPDYPKLGVWPNGYYLTFNYFSGNNLDTFNGAGIVILDRNAMLADDQSAQANASGPLGSTIASMLPVTVDDAGAPASGLPESIAAVDTNSTAGGSALQWWHVSNVSWGASLGARLERLADLPVATYSWDLCNQSRNCIPQPGTKVGLDTLSDRLMYRAGYRTIGGTAHVVLNHTVNVGTSGTHAAIRWYDVVNPSSTPSVAQQGTYSPDAANRWTGSAAMDSAGDLAVGYSVSSGTTYPSLRYAGRSPSDSFGTLGAETTLKAGGGSQTSSSNRWGDYSSLVVDPVDGCTLWYTSEYYASTANYSWSTWIGSFSFPGCGVTQAPAAPSGLIATATAGTSDQVDLSWTGSSGASGYYVYRDGTKLPLVSGTSFHDSGLSPSTQYSYVVTATNAAGDSGPSNTALVTTNAATVSPPGSFTLSGSATSATSVRLTWTPSSGANSYAVYRRKGSKGGPTLVGGCVSSGCNDTGLSPATSYSYFVIASNSGGQTTSNTLTVRTPKR